MVKPREPKIKLRTMRIFWGVMAVLFIIQFPLQFSNGNTLLGIIQLMIVLLFGWYAIIPPPYVRKRFIQ